MIIDSHAHVVLPVEEHIRLMNEAGIDKTILFSTSIHPEKAETMAEFEQEIRLLGEIITGKRNAAEIKKAANRENYEITTRYPDRFVGFGNIPHGLDYKETAAWVEQEVIQYRFIGLGEFTLPAGQVHTLKNSFAAAREFGNLPIWVHAFWPLTLQDIKALAELAGQFPEVPVIIGHLGGMHWLDTLAIAKEQKNLYLDLSAVFTAVAVKIAVKELPERCLFSSDMPYGDVLLAKQTVERFCSNPHIRELVLGGNVAALLERRT